MKIGQSWTAGLYALSVALFGVLVLAATPSPAAISWDGEANSPWWFDPVNWDAAGNANTILPPASDTAGTTVTDTVLRTGSGPWDLGEGVIYDPANDPFFAAAASRPFPPNFGPQSIAQLYVTRNTPSTNRLTIKGDLTAQGPVIVGRSSGTRGLASEGRIVQTAGAFVVPLSSLDLGHAELSNNGLGNGTYDYRGGTLEVSMSGGSGLRLSVGTASAAPDGLPAGAGGVGKLIVHNPATHDGHLRAFDMTFSAYAGAADGVFTLADPNGVTTGVSIADFHYENGGLRPVQISRNLSINNGLDPNTLGVRSARLSLELDAPVPVNAGGVPMNLGLLDVDFDHRNGTITGTGSLGRYFSSADGLTLYSEGSVVSASFAGQTYKWQISYVGDIKWSDSNSSVVSSITGAGTGQDVVLIGLRSVPEPSMAGLVGMAAALLFIRRGSSPLKEIAQD